MKTINLRFILIIITGFFYSVASFANNNLGEWKPQIVEKMYLLPPKHLNKALNNDFNKSILTCSLIKDKNSASFSDFFVSFIKVSFRSEL